MNKQTFQTLCLKEIIEIVLRQKPVSLWTRDIGPEKEGCLVLTYSTLITMNMLSVMTMSLDSTEGLNIIKSSTLSCRWMEERMVTGSKS